jgi:hypothetical protein
MHLKKETFAVLFHGCKEWHGKFCIKKSPTSAVPCKRTIYSTVEKFHITISVLDSEREYKNGISVG